MKRSERYLVAAVLLAAMALVPTITVAQNCTAACNPAAPFDCVIEAMLSIVRGDTCADPNAITEPPETPEEALEGGGNDADCQPCWDRGLGCDVDGNCVDAPLMR
jgi:hypothetical protein